MAVRKSAKGSSRSALLRAAETLMRESGYAAVTSRALAARAGLKPQLVHYYFRTMDDLFLALWQRRADNLFAQQDEILKSPKPLKAVWNVTCNQKDIVLSY